MILDFFSMQRWAARFLDNIRVHHNETIYFVTTVERCKSETVDYGKASTKTGPEDGHLDSKHKHYHSRANENPSLHWTSRFLAICSTEKG